MSLTHAAIKAARPREKPYKLFDERGLYLLVETSGARLWRFKYRYGGREKLISLGTYPDVSLLKARNGRDEARKQVAAGIDPSAQRRAVKSAEADSFAAIAEEYFTMQEPKLAAATRVRDRRLLNKLIEHIGNRPISAVSAPELLGALRDITKNGAHESAHRARSLAGRIFRYAIATGRAERDPSGDLRGALPPVVARSRAAITDPTEIGKLLRAIDGYQGEPATVAGLKLLALLFVRPGELRQARWCEIDLEKRSWTVPAERTKMRREHLVPLSAQAVQLFRDLHSITDGDDLVFPSLRPGRPLSENTFNTALRTMGFRSEQMSAHGFRALASTLLHEEGFPPEVIELQLAHAQRNQVAAAYNRSARLPERVRMMQMWADHLDVLRAGAKVTPIRKMLV